MVPARLPGVAVHALLDHHPLAVVGDDEAVQIEVEPVLHGGAVDPWRPAGWRGASAVPSKPVRSPIACSSCGGLAACAGRVRRRHCRPSSAESGVRPRFRAPSTLVVMPDECQSIPITAPKDWNQNGWGQAAQELVAAVMMHDRLGDDRAQPCHAGWRARAARGRHGAAGRRCRHAGASGGGAKNHAPLYPESPSRGAPATTRSIGPPRRHGPLRGARDDDQGRRSCRSLNFGKAFIVYAACWRRSPLFWPRTIPSGPKWPRTALNACGGSARSWRRFVLSARHRCRGWSPSPSSISCRWWPAWLI